MNFHYLLKQYSLKFDPFSRELNQVIDRSKAYFLAEEARDSAPFAQFACFYGEMEQASLLCLLDIVQPQPNEKFIDLGAGAGLSVLWAAASNKFARVTGIEIIPTLFELSEQHRLTCLRMADKKQRAISPCYFKQADFLEYDWSDADVVLINATCFIGELWDEIKKLLCKLASGARVILISKHLEDRDDFKLLHSKRYPMSWGKAMAAVYLKL